MDRGRKLAGIVTPAAAAADSNDSCLKKNQGKPLEHKTVRPLAFLQAFIRANLDMSEKYS